MADTPKSISVRVDINGKEVKAKVDQAYAVGEAAGLQRGRAEILSFLEDKYLGEDAPDRGSTQGEAILTLAREAAEHLRGLAND